jgi:hypothetical protein
MTPMPKPQNYKDSQVNIRINPAAGSHLNVARQWRLKRPFKCYDVNHRYRPFADSLHAENRHSDLRKPAVRRIGSFQPDWKARKCLQTRGDSTCK